MRRIPAHLIFRQREQRTLAAEENKKRAKGGGGSDTRFHGETEPK